MDAGTSESEANTQDMWDDDGMWVGPRSLRVFLRANPSTAIWWLLVLTVMFLCVWGNIDGVPSFWVALLLALLSAAGPTLFVMFAFSRGWATEGDC